MSGLLYLAGLIIGFAIFAYLYSLYQSGKDKVTQWTGKKGEEAEPTVEPKNIINTFQEKRPPGARICPLCGSTLTKYEALYASNVNDETGSKILIHGCRYCYKPEENPEEVKKSAL